MTKYGEPGVGVSPALKRAKNRSLTYKGHALFCLLRFEFIKDEHNQYPNGRFNERR